MNNIEINAMKADLKKYLRYSDEDLNNLHSMNEVKLSKLKKIISDMKNKEYKVRIKQKIDRIFMNNPELTKKRILDGSGVGSGVDSNSSGGKGKIIKSKKIEEPFKEEKKYVSVGPNRKPRILFISDVKGWAWWIKSEYLKKHLSDEFDIDITHTIQDNGRPVYDNVYKKEYDLYFTYGFSYINILNRIPKNKRVTGVTAHRARNVIFPKMKLAGHHHANSMLLLKELQEMGFRKTYYVPNGVDETLFRPIKPIKQEGDLIVGHVGKETPMKGQREFILPAIQQTGCKSFTNMRTWKDKLPHNEMPKIYNNMDVFMVASVEDGTPNPALEAAACGRPIISNRIGNMPELIIDGYNGFIVPRKIGAYIEKIKYFQNNRSELIRMGENARKTIEEGWTWRLQSEKYRKMFNDIFKRN